MIGSAWTRRDFLATSAASALWSAGRRAGFKAHATVWAYFGTGSHGGSTGIYRSAWDGAKGELKAPDLVAEAKDAAFIIGCPAQSGIPKMIYGATEIRGAQGSVLAFRVESNGALVPTGVQPSGGETSVHLATDRTGKMLMVANFGTGSLSSFRRNRDGSLSAAVEHLQYSGHGGNLQRQAGPHTHGIAASPDNRFVLINDLGLDKIMVYRVDPLTAKLTVNDPAAYEAPPATGPRHTVFHPMGQWAYSLNELDCTVTSMHWDAARGVLTRGASANVLPEGQKAGYPGRPATSAGTSPTAAIDPSKVAPARGNAAAELCLSADGRFIYATNRGDYDCITVFGVNTASGELTVVQRMPSGGNGARHIRLDATGKWAIVCCQNSGEVLVFARNPESGELRAHQSTPLQGAGTTVLI